MTSTTDHPESHTHSDRDERARDLLVQERASSDGAIHRADAMFERLLAAEAESERRVRRAALVSWGVALGCVAVFVASMGAVRNLGGDTVELARMILVFVSIVGVVSLLAGAVTSLAWLFRSRRATLRAIDRRLASLEQAITRAAAPAR